MSSYFENDVITIWLTGSDEDHDMELTAAFAFVEPSERWDAPAGSVVNGASIPSGLWSIIRESVRRELSAGGGQHDVYYRNHQGKTRKEVDDMFENAMLTDGVSTEKARLMYAGVRIGGGSAWDEADATKMTKAAPEVDWSEFETWFESEGAGLNKESLDDAIEKRFGPNL